MIKPHTHRIKPHTHTRHDQTTHTHTHTHRLSSSTRPRICALRRTQTYSDVLYILLPSSGTPASVRSDGRQPSFPSVCRPSRRAGCFLPSCDAPAFTGISVERAKRVKSEGPGISVEREKRVKSEVRLACGWPAAVKHLRLACGWPAAVKHARKAPQNPVPTALSTRFQHTLKRHGTQGARAGTRSARQTNAGMTTLARHSGALSNLTLSMQKKS